MDIQHCAIAGVLRQKLAIIPTENGDVLHMLKANSPLAPDFGKGFGEIYFSEVLPGHIKAWKRHRKQTQLFAVPRGIIKIVLYDDRIDSPSFGKLLDMELRRPDNYWLLKIPPQIWYGFTAIGKEVALICNCADLPHKPEEGERLDSNSTHVPWRWA